MIKKLSTVGLLLLVALSVTPATADNTFTYPSINEIRGQSGSFGGYCHDSTSTPDGKKILMAWCASQMQIGQGLKIAYSTDGGEYWSPEIVISRDKYISNPRLAISENGLNLYVVWHGYDSANVSRNYFSRSTNGGETWSIPKYISLWEAGRINQAPRINTDPSGQNIVIDYTTSGDSSDLERFHITTSQDYGLSWSKVVVVDSASINASRTISISQDGRSIAILYPEYKSGEYQVSISTDFGLTFQPPKIIKGFQYFDTYPMALSSDSQGNFYWMTTKNDQVFEFGVNKIGDLISTKKYNCDSYPLLQRGKSGNSICLGISNYNDKNEYRLVLQISDTLTSSAVFELPKNLRRPLSWEYNEDTGNIYLVFNNSGNATFVVFSTLLNSIVYNKELDFHSKFIGKAKVINTSAHEIFVELVADLDSIWSAQKVILKSRTFKVSSGSDSFHAWQSYFPVGSSVNLKNLEVKLQKIINSKIQIRQGTQILDPSSVLLLDEDTFLTVESLKPTVLHFSIMGLDGKVLYNDEFEEGAIVSLTPYALKYPKKQGYSLVGWAFASNSSQIDFGASETLLIDRSLALYPVWNKKAVLASIRCQNMVTKKLVKLTATSCPQGFRKLK